MTKHDFIWIVFAVALASVLFRLALGLCPKQAEPIVYGKAVA